MRIGIALAVAAVLGSGPAPAVDEDSVHLDGFETPAACTPASPPVAFEVPGNGLDDDCDGQSDEPGDVCDLGLASGTSIAADYARALDLCQPATEIGTGWGLISATLTLTSGAGTPNAVSRAVRTAFGTDNPPRAGFAYAVLSSGTAAAPGQTNPAHFGFQFQGGFDAGTQSAAPADWLQANGGAFDFLADCPAPLSTTANDNVMLTLRVRAPVNARSFRVAIRLLSSEYPEYVCSQYNDVFLVLLDSVYTGVPPNPADKNLARYIAPGGADYPIGVNLVVGNTGLFTQCRNGAVGCLGVMGTHNACVSTSGLAGTGMDVAVTSCSVNDQVGGATAWLDVGGIVIPGEIFTLRLAIIDTGDHLFDSVVLIDDFRWSTARTVPGTNPAP